MISVEMIEDLFERTRKLRREGKVAWEIDDVCRWSYFFVDSSREKLLGAGHQLEALGYELIGLLEPEDDDQATIFLRVDRVERHTVAMTSNHELQANDQLPRCAQALARR